MNETEERHDTPETGMPADGERGQADPAPDADAMTGEQAEELVEIARAGDADVPVGAEDFVEALRLVAAQRDQNRDLLQRTAADYQNFQRRARQNERETRELTAAGVVQSLLQVLDFFDMALKQDPEKATVAQVMGGVEMIKAEFLRVLSNHGVAPVFPVAGDAFDPHRHEAVENTSESGVEPGHVVEVRSPGFTMGDRVIRPAKVVVAVEASPESGDATEQEG
ncbi:MAG: nucleotide exchange factor GrpE [Phycisphaeraceae bacterium]|nr:MAG: nucleotide exchange factor GrpE [Phycisphaeraceae bacterium]